MKLNNSLAVFAALLLLSGAVYSQHQHGDQSKSQETPKGMSQMMGKPVLDQSVDEIRLQLWLMTQEEHKKMMGHQKDHSMSKDRGMKHGMMEMHHGEMDHGGMHDTKDSAHSGMMQAMMVGTHHVMAVLTDETVSKEAADATVEIEAISPSKNSSSIILQKMMNHFGGGISLEEKGAYKLSIKIKTAEKIRTFTTNYEVD